MIELFKYIDFETIGSCNRVCPTCIRNSHPDRDEISSWFSERHLPVWVIKQALDQCVEMGFKGGVCLSHYNEPLMDRRLPEIAELVRSYGRFHPIFLNTNGDLLNTDLAKRLDGLLDHIIISLYTDKAKRQARASWMTSLFNSTRVDACVMTDHIPTHFSPKFNVEGLAEQHRGRICAEAKIRVVINHRRQYLLCCDDVVGNFDLGTFPEINIADYWYGEKHTKLVQNLEQKGGRLLHDYCASCPRP